MPSFAVDCPAVPSSVGAAGAAGGAGAGTGEASTGGPAGVTTPVPDSEAVTVPLTASLGMLRVADFAPVEPGAKVTDTVQFSPGCRRLVWPAQVPPRANWDASAPARPGTPASRARFPVFVSDRVVAEVDPTVWEPKLADDAERPAPGAAAATP